MTTALCDRCGTRLRYDQGQRRHIQPPALDRRTLVALVQARHPGLQRYQASLLAQRCLQDILAERSEAPRNEAAH